MSESENQGSVAQAQDKAQDVKEQAAEKAQEVKQQAGDRVREQVDTRSTQAGEQVATTADAIRRVGEQLRSDGNHGQARYADQVADRADRVGRYLTQADADRMLGDIERFARRQPWLAVVGGAALGFLASRFVKASSANRYGESYARELNAGVGIERPASVADGVGEPWSPQAGRSGGLGEV
jgi:ElaB/YqjD/DUF883 family membrane-anchored ribosome-binding protein